MNTHAFVTVYLRYPTRFNSRKKSVATHIFEDENFKTTSRRRISLEEFEHDYLSRRKEAFSEYERKNSGFLALTFEN